MNQTLHIFRKDTRCLWLEILISLVALSVMTWTEWWLSTPNRDPRWYNQAAPTILLVLSWWVMAARLIQEESLVGDRQFWTTRPYNWGALLAANALFVAVWIGVPLGISQVVLVVADRASVVPQLGGILAGSGATILFLVLPAAAIAALTRNLIQWMTVTIVGVLVFAGVMTLLDSYVRDSHVPTGTDISDNLQAIVFSCLIVSGITLQYARRHKRTGAALVVAAIALVPVIVAATPHRAIIGRAFPLSSQDQIPVRLELLPAPKPERTGLDISSDGTIRVVIPLEVSGIPEDLLLMIDGVMLSIGSADGKRWESEWRPDYQEVLWGGKRVSMTVQVDRAVFERVKNVATDVQLSVAISQFRDQRRQRVLVSSLFSVPGIGPCWFENDGNLKCRSVASGPRYLLLTASNDDQSCQSAVSDNRITRYLNTDSAEGPFNPLSIRTFYLWLQQQAGCRYSALTFSTPELERRFRLELQLGQLRLQDYAAPKPVFEFSQVILVPALKK